VRDYFCGTGRVVDAARAAGYAMSATDIVDRGYQHFDGLLDFLTLDRLDPDVSIIANPPFEDRILQHSTSCMAGTKKAAANERCNYFLRHIPCSPAVRITDAAKQV
jgi:hypothetical protein